MPHKFTTSIELLIVFCFTVPVFSQTTNAPTPIRFPTGEQLLGINVSDIEFTPDDKRLLLIADQNIYQYDYQLNTIEPMQIETGHFPEMEWLHDHQLMVFFERFSPVDSTYINGVLFRWPTFEVVKTGIEKFRISADRHSILYSEAEKSTFTLLDLKTGIEEAIPPLSALQIVDFDPQARTLTFTQGEWKNGPYGEEIDTVYLNTVDYRSAEIIHSVTLEGAYFNKGTSFPSSYARVDLRIQGLSMNREFIFAYTHASSSRTYPSTYHKYFAWKRSTGESVTRISDLTGISCSIMNPPLSVFSPSGKWFSIPYPSCGNITIFNTEEGLSGDLSIDIGPFQKGKHVFSHDEKKLAIFQSIQPYCYPGNVQGRLTIIDLVNGEELRDHYLPRVPSIIVPHPDDEQVLLKHTHCFFELYNRDRLSLTALPVELIHDFSFYEAASFSQHGDRLFWGYGNEIQLWNTHEWHKLTETTFLKTVYTIRFSPSEQYLLVITAQPSGTSRNQSEVIMLEADTLKKIGRLGDIHPGKVYACFSPDEQRIITASDNGIVAVWDWRENRKIFVFDHEYPAVYAKFLLDGMHAASASTDRVVHIWNTYNGEIVQTFQNVNLPVRLSPNDDLLFCGTQVWDLHSKELVKVLDGNEMDLNLLEISPSGEILFTSTDAVTKVWSVPEHILDLNRVDNSLLHR